MCYLGSHAGKQLFSVHMAAFFAAFDNIFFALNVLFLAYMEMTPPREECVFYMMQCIMVTLLFPLNFGILPESLSHLDHLLSFPR